jgi:hypothetical protein
VPVLDFACHDRESPGNCVYPLGQAGESNWSLMRPDHGMSHGQPWSAQRFQCQRNVLSCRRVMRRQASLSNASWMSAHRSKRIRRRRKPRSQAKLLSPDPAVDARSGAVQGAAAGDRGHDAAGADLVSVYVVVAPAVGEQRFWLPARMTDPAADRRDCVEQGQELGDAVAVAAGQQHRERGAVARLI